MASILLFRPGMGAPALPRPAGSREPLAHRLTALLRQALARRRLEALGDRQLRDLGLARADVEDPLAACLRARAWAEQGSVGWAVGTRPVARR